MPLKNIRENSKHHSIPQAISTLTSLNIRLTGTSLQNLQFFNNTYLIITKNIYKAIQNGTFTHKKGVQELILHFLAYYFGAVNDYANKKKVAAAWKIAFQFCEERRSNNLLYLAIAANAHINNDLCFALQEINGGLNFYSDYQKIGDVIVKSIRKSISPINKQSNYLTFIDRHLLGIYIIIITFLVGQWRKAAWNNYLRLKADSSVAKQIAQTARRKATHISAIAYIIPY